MIKRYEFWSDFDDCGMSEDSEGEWVKWQDIKYYLEEEYLAGYDRGWAERGEAEGIINE